LSISREDVKKIVKEALREETKEHVHTPSREEIVRDNVKIVCEDGECYAGVVEASKKFKYQCADCGMPIPDSMVSSKPFESNPAKCPNCGSVEAEKREGDEED